MEDHFFHIEDEGLNVKLDLKEKLGDVKVVLMSGPPARAELMAKEVSEAFHWPVVGMGSKERYALFKVGPVMCVSHGIGQASQSIILHELTKVLHYAAATDVTYVRVGTSGGVGVDPGTIVVASEGVNPALESSYDVTVLGKRKSYPTNFDPETIDGLERAAKRAKIPVKVGKTMATNDYYEEQGRLDGAVETGYTEAEKMAWLQKLSDHGVLNMEMEGPGLAGFCNRTKIRAGMVCAALLNRLHGDQTPKQATPAQMKQWTNDTVSVVIEWLREKLGKQATIVQNQAGA